MLKVKVSGGYLKDQKTRDYQIDDLLIPETNAVRWACLRRAVPMRLLKDGVAADYIRSCYIESVEEIENRGETMEFAMKSIKDYTHEDCQNAAIYYGLISVPVYRSTDLTETRERTYRAYLEEVLKKDTRGFDYQTAGPLKPELKAGEIILSDKKIKN